GESTPPRSTSRSIRTPEAAAVPTPAADRAGCRTFPVRPGPAPDRNRPPANRPVCREAWSRGLRRGFHGEALAHPLVHSPLGAADVAVALRFEIQHGV